MIYQVTEQVSVIRNIIQSCLLCVWRNIIYLKLKICKCGAATGNRKQNINKEALPQNPEVYGEVWKGGGLLTKEHASYYSRHQFKHVGCLFLRGDRLRPEPLNPGLFICLHLVCHERAHKVAFLSYRSLEVRVVHVLILQPVLHIAPNLLLTTNYEQRTSNHELLTTNY